MTNPTSHSVDLSALAAMISAAPRPQVAQATPAASRFRATDFQPRVRDGAVLIAGTLTP